MGSADHVVSSMAEPSAPSSATHPENDPAKVGFEAVQILSQRFSLGPKYLTTPGPDLAHLHLAARMSLRAPDHLRTRPFRFVIISDDRRTALAELFAQDAQKRGLPTHDVERARSRAWNGPSLVALIGRVHENEDRVPKHEQWVCVGAGLMNFMNALHLLGYGVKVLSGASVQSPAIHDAICQSGETLVAWLVAGTPLVCAQAKHDDEVDGVLSVWT